MSGCETCKERGREDCPVHRTHNGVELSTWSVGDPEPGIEVNRVTGASGTVWVRSLPGGLFWFPQAGGTIRHWAPLLDLDGPVTADGPLTLFDLGVAS